MFGRLRILAIAGLALLASLAATRAAYADEGGTASDAQVEAADSDASAGDATPGNDAGEDGPGDLDQIFGPALVG